MEAQETALLKPLAGAPTEEVKYPSTDGNQFAQSTWHADAIVLAREALVRHFSRRDDVFVAVDLLLYYEKGNNKARLSPDVLVSFNVAGTGRGRSSYLLWEEGKPPEFVLEVASRSTYTTDAEEKLWKYAAIGVEEYWRLDPRGGLMVEALEGHRLRDGAYEPIQAAGRAGRAWCRSEALRLDVGTKPLNAGRGLAFRNPLTGQEVLSGEEVDQVLAAEKERRIQAEAKAAKAQTRAARAQARAAKESDLRIQAEERMLAERRARLEAERRLAELMKEIESKS